MALKYEYIVWVSTVQLHGHFGVCVKCRVEVSGTFARERGRVSVTSGSLNRIFTLTWQDILMTFLTHSKTPDLKC